MSENKPQQKPDQRHNTETERTHEMPEKETAAPVTHDAGKEGQDSNVHTQADNGELGQSNTQTTDPGKLNRGESL